MALEFTYERAARPNCADELLLRSAVIQEMALRWGAAKPLRLHGTSLASGIICEDAIDSIATAPIAAASNDPNALLITPARGAVGEGFRSRPLRKILP